MQNGEVRGHVTVWCEEAARLVDPALLIGQSRLAPDAVEREIFRSPVVFPAPDLNALLGISPATHREGYLLAYEFRLDWEEHLRGAIEHLDKAAVASLARVLAASATLAADTGLYA